MKTFHKTLIAVVLLAVLALVAVPAFAQTPAASTKTVTLTEEEANQLYRVTNPRYRSVENVVVDFQPGQTVISATITLRGKDPVAVAVTLVPSITRGHIYWAVTVATANGEPVSDELLAQINASITSSWRYFIRQQAPDGRVTSIEITEDALVLTWAVGRK
ncbi:MAG: hypothetical protein BroJett038_21100 [Chloroflexota bacterium]|nr:MAG: hypothetical protein BroJett038_21100 [Chloroflexota bacterium]